MSEQDETPGGRRGFLQTGAQVAMAGSVAVSYGTFAAISGRFLYPARPDLKGWMFVAPVAELEPDTSLDFTTPTGAKAVIARQGRTGGAEDFIALSSVCPHLGCQVHFEAPKNRFYCPCHNGTFDPNGKATGGPPAQAKQELLKFPLKVVDGLLFIQVPMESIASGDGLGDSPGHDPCLSPRKQGEHA